MNRSTTNTCSQIKRWETCPKKYIKSYFRSNTESQARKSQCLWIWGQLVKTRIFYHVSVALCFSFSSTHPHPIATALMHLDLTSSLSLQFQLIQSVHFKKCCSICPNLIHKSHPPPDDWSRYQQWKLTKRIMSSESWCCPQH